MYVHVHRCNTVVLCVFFPIIISLFIIITGFQIITCLHLTSPSWLFLQQPLSGKGFGANLRCFSSWTWKFKMKVGQRVNLHGLLVQALSKQQ